VLPLRCAHVALNVVIEHPSSRASSASRGGQETQETRTLGRSFGRSLWTLDAARITCSGALITCRLRAGIGVDALTIHRTELARLSLLAQLRATLHAARVAWPGMGAR
jgi:hypothetical protein